MLACIPPNPDIAGFGVRASIYVQTFLTFVPAFIFSADGEIDKEEYKHIKTISTNILLTAFALLLSAFVQTATSGLSVYHAMIILNLSWINSTTFITYSLIYIAYRRSTIQGGILGILPKLMSLFRSRQAVMVVVLASAHLCFMAGFGIWVWSDIDDYGGHDSRECTLQTVTVTFGISSSVTAELLHIMSLVLYSITAIPFFNIIISTAVLIVSITIPLSIIHSLIHWWKPVIDDQLSHDRNIVRIACYIALLITATIDILLIVDTELTIWRNRQLVQPEESRWSFGQTLALLLIILPLVDVATVVWEESRKEKNRDGRVSKKVRDFNEDRVARQRKVYGGQGDHDQTSSLLLESLPV